MGKIKISHSRKELRRLLGGSIGGFFISDREQAKRLKEAFARKRRNEENAPSHGLPPEIMEQVYSIIEEEIREQNALGSPREKEEG